MLGNYGCFDGVPNPVMPHSTGRIIFSTENLSCLTTSPNMFIPDVIHNIYPTFRHHLCFGGNVSLCVCVPQWVQPWLSSSLCAVWQRSSSCACVCVSASASSVRMVSLKSKLFFFFFKKASHLHFLNSIQLLEC